MKGISAVAKNALRNVLNVGPGTTVTVETWTHTLEDAEEFVYESRRLGAHPILVYEDEATYWKAAGRVPPSVLGKLARHEEALLRQTDAYVFLYGPARESERRRLGAGRIGQLEAYNQSWYSIARASHVRFARLELGRVSEDRARDFHTNARAWREELVRASAVPPAVMERNARRLRCPLEKGGEVRIQHPNGTDLTLRLLRRKATIDTGGEGSDPGNWIHVLPAGSLLVAVDERYAEGRVFGNGPKHPRPGAPTGGSWQFHRGSLVDFSYEENQASFERGLRSAGKEGARIGLLGLGLNPRIDVAPRCEYERLGSVLVSVGGNRDQGGKNRAGWMEYLLLRDPSVTVDGTNLLTAGKVVNEARGSP